MSDFNKTTPQHSHYSLLENPEENHTQPVEPPIGAIPIKSVRPRHNAIMDFILANPTIQMGAVAAHFGVSRSWLSIIVNSDCFQGMMREKQEKMFDEMIIPLSDKLNGVAHLALEKLGEKLADSDDPSFILDSSDKLLKNLGYGAKSSPPSPLHLSIGDNANVAMVNSSVLEEARSRMLERTKATLPPPVEPPPVEGTEGTEE